jgi:hypothetical protein
MSVHIGELHTEVSASTPAVAIGPDTGPAPDPVAQVAEALRRAQWLAERVAAEGFDD